MSRPAITLLGAFQVQRGGTAVTRFRGDKVRALLAYLAVEDDRPHARGALVGLLWPDQPDDAARRNLTQALVRLREALGPDAAPFEVTREVVRWDPGAADVDVADFVRHARSAEPADLARAATLYRGEFLAGFALPDCEGFEEWLLLTRERLQQVALAALHALATWDLAAGRPAPAAEAARRQLALDPWREAAHRQLIAALAAAGDRVAALAAYARCRQTLRAGLGVEPDPETRALAARIRAGEESVGAQVVTAAASRVPAGASLPAPATPLLGREVDLAHLDALLTDPARRLVTMVGPGGVGKTRLALAVAERHAAAFADGVCFVDLTPIIAPDRVAPAIAVALGVREGAAQPLSDTLAAALRDRHLLLVLDNFERVVGAAPLVAALLAACPHLRVVATSRVPLHLQGEQEYPVEPLALPGGVAPPDPAALAASPAVALFAARARAVRPDFALTVENGAAVAAICARLDGLPLAIELAAARVKLLPPQALLARLDHRLDLLTGGARDLPAHQQTLRGTLAWSHDLLDDAGRRLFRRLGTFSGGATLEAIAAVAADEEGHDALDGVAELVDHHLLQQADEAGGEPGLRMLETVREYAVERLEASGEAAAVGRRHAAFFLARVEAAEPQLVGPQELLWRGRLSAEMENLRAALRWALDRRDAEIGLRLAGAMWLLWDMQGAYSEGRGWLAALLAIDEAGATGELYRAARAKALNVAALLTLRMGDFLPAAEYAAGSLALYRALGDRQGVARALMTLGNVEGLGLEEFDRAVARYEEAIELQRAQHNREGVGVALFNLGLLELGRGGYARAGDRFTEARAHYAALGSARWVIRLQPYRAAAAHLLGDLVGAAAMLAEALTERALAEVKDPTFTVQSLLVSAGIAEAQGQAPRAAQLLGAVDRLNAVHGVRGRPIAARRRLYETINSAVRTRLDEAEFASARAAGQSMTLERAIGAARDVIAPANAPAYAVPEDHPPAPGASVA